MQMTPRVPRLVWDAARIVSFAAALAVCMSLLVAPRVGLDIFWGLLIPLLPLLFFLAPGFWRNVCPLATANQAPRRLGFQRARSLPPVVRAYGFLIPVAAFLALVPARKVLFDTNGLALGILLLGMLGLAFAGGVAFKGKSGWCSSFCPLLPVQRVYGQTPFLVVRNSHCEPCVGCAKNCYDFNPHVAQIADFADDDPYRGAYRKIFAGAFPGLVLAFYTTSAAGGSEILELYGRFGVFVLGGIGAFFLLDSLLRFVSSAALAVFFGAAALDIYYWFNWPLVARPDRGRRAGMVRLAGARGRLRTQRRLGRADAPEGASVHRGDLGAARGQARRRRRRSARRGRCRSAPRGDDRARRAADRSSRGVDPARPRRAARRADRSRLQAGDVRQRSRLGGRRRREPVPRRRRGADDDRAAGTGEHDPHGLLRTSGRSGDDLARAATRRARCGADRRPGRRPDGQARRRDRKRHRWDHGRRSRSQAASRLRDRRRHPRALSPLQPDGDHAPDLRPVRHAEPLPDAGAVVRGPPDHDVVEHPGHGDRPRRAACLARYRRDDPVRPADPHGRQPQLRSADRRFRRTRQLRPARGRGRDAAPRVRAGTSLPARRRRRRRAPRARVGLRVEEVRAARDRRRSRREPAQASAGRARRRTAATVPRGARNRDRRRDAGRLGATGTRASGASRSTTGRRSRPTSSSSPPASRRTRRSLARRASRPAAA